MSLDTLILPSETRAREFDAKLLLACHAAQAGLRTVIGAKKNIDLMLDSIAPGIYVGKSVTDRNLGVYTLAQALGHTVTAWDEEGLVYADAQVYRATKVGARALNLPAALYAWGADNADAWRGHPEFNGGPIHLTGNPRADLLRPELRAYFEPAARALTQRFGDFILVNTNFSRMNHYYPKLSRQRVLLQDGGDVIRQADDPRLGLAAHKEQLYAAFLALVPALARQFPQHTVVVRPHPSENEAAWREAAAGCANVQVVRDGSAVPWLLAARVMIHNGCTTAVESWLLDKPALAFQPVTSARYDHPLPNGLSVVAASLDELLARVADALGSTLTIADSERSAQGAWARRHIASVDGASACDRLVPLFTALASGATAQRRTLRGRWRAWRRRTDRRIESALPGHRNNRAYLTHMFPPLGVAEVEVGVARLGALLGRFDRLRVRALGESVFAVEPA